MSSCLLIAKLSNEERDWYWLLPITLERNDTADPAMLPKTLGLDISIAGPRLKGG